MIKAPLTRVMSEEQHNVDNGCLKVKPSGIDKSSIMVSIKDADCLIWLPAGGQGYKRGDGVKVYTTR